MADLNRWSLNASEAGNTASPPDGAPEGWVGEKVNDWGREAMASIRRWYEAPQFIDIMWEKDPYGGDATKQYDRVTDTQFTVLSIDDDVTGALIDSRMIRMQPGNVIAYIDGAPLYVSPNLTVNVKGGAVPAGITGFELHHHEQWMGESFGAGEILIGQTSLAPKRLAGVQGAVLTVDLAGDVDWIASPPSDLRLLESLGGLPVWSPQPRGNIYIENRGTAGDEIPDNDEVDARITAGLGLSAVGVPASDITVGTGLSTVMTCVIPAGALLSHRWRGLLLLDVEQGQRQNAGSSSAPGFQVRINVNGSTKAQFSSTSAGAYVHTNNSGRWSWAIPFPVFFAGLQNPGADPASWAWNSSVGGNDLTKPHIDDVVMVSNAGQLSLTASTNIDIACSNSRPAGNLDSHAIVRATSFFMLNQLVGVSIP